jgi:3-deoxy-D-manno-octulosonic-acid transferase
MFILYDLIYLVFVIIYLPVFLFRKRIRRGFKMRLGILPKDLKLDKPIWIHAVSVGEMMAAKKMLQALRQHYPHNSIVISTVTETGNKIARGLCRENNFVFYLPLDFSFLLNRVINLIRPTLVILLETEIWPNLITLLSRKGIPVIIVNCRISDRSFKGYSFVKYLIKPVLKRITLFCVQTQDDAQRLACLGVSKERIKITGNMKYDVTYEADKNSRDCTDKIKARLSLKSTQMLLTAASTHPGEEEIVLRVYKNLVNEFGNLRLLIAPRHPQRATDIEKTIIKYGFNPVRLSRLEGIQLGRLSGLPVEPLNRLSDSATQRLGVFILDTIGQLNSFYAISDIVFVGGSLVKKGGQNILEPASFEKAVIFGPYMFNFREIAQLFLSNEASIQIQNEAQLTRQITYLLKNPAGMSQMGKRAREIVSREQGATRRNLEYINKILNSKLKTKTH